MRKLNNYHCEAIQILKNTTVSRQNISECLEHLSVKCNELAQDLFLCSDGTLFLVPNKMDCIEAKTIFKIHKAVIQKLNQHKFIINNTASNETYQINSEENVVDMFINRFNITNNESMNDHEIDKLLQSTYPLPPIENDRWQDIDDDTAMNAYKDIILSLEFNPGVNGHTLLVKSYADIRSNDNLQDLRNIPHCSCGGGFEYLFYKPPACKIQLDTKCANRKGLHHLHEYWASDCSICIDCYALQQILEQRAEQVDLTDFDYENCIPIKFYLSDLEIIFKETSGQKRIQRESLMTIWPKLPKYIKTITKGCFLSFQKCCSPFVAGWVNPKKIQYKISDKININTYECFKLHHVNLGICRTADEVITKQQELNEISKTIELSTDNDALKLFDADAEILKFKDSIWYLYRIDYHQAQKKLFHANPKAKRKYLRQKKYGYHSMAITFKGILDGLKKYLGNTYDQSKGIEFEVAQMQRQQYKQLPKDSKHATLEYHRDIIDLNLSGFNLVQCGQDGKIRAKVGRKGSCGECVVITKERRKAYFFVGGSISATDFTHQVINNSDQKTLYDLNIPEFSSIQSTMLQKKKQIVNLTLLTRCGPIKGTPSEYISKLDLNKRKEIAKNQRSLSKQSNNERRKQKAKETRKYKTKSKTTRKRKRNYLDSQFIAQDDEPIDIDDGNDDWLTNVIKTIKPIL